MAGKFKVAVYSICKNEAQNIARYLDVTKEADGVFVLDTGSTDNSIALLKQEYLSKPHLKNVTLISIDLRSDQALIDKAVAALEYSCRGLNFGAVKLVAGCKPSAPSVALEFYHVEEPVGMNAYNNFMLNNLADYIDTEFCLVIQADGFVTNPQAWTDEFLKYDYIGAPWWGYGRDKIIGNGGFSLRSKKLLKLCQGFKNNGEHPEDDVVCVQKRAELEAAGIKFAPLELAYKFSTETQIPDPALLYKPCHALGFHGTHNPIVKMLGARLDQKPTPKHVTIKEAKIEPWRFDTARNMSLDMIPEDYDFAVILDLDEKLEPGWREALEWHWKEKANRVQATFIFSYKADGVTPDLVFFMDRAHARKGYKWSGIVHEHLVLDGSGLPDVMHPSSVFKVSHHQNILTNRTQYLTLLERATQENPNHDRNAHYLGREYWYYKQYAKCIAELTRHLKLPTATWEAERSASMRYIGQSYEAQQNIREAERWYVRACAEWPEDREPWMLLGLFYSAHKNYAGGYYCANQMLKITERPLHYMTTAGAWGALPHDLAACCAFYLGFYSVSLEHYKKALELEPGHTRIQSDYKMVMELIAKQETKT